MFVLLPRLSPLIISTSFLMLFPGLQDFVRFCNQLFRRGSYLAAGKRYFCRVIPVIKDAARDQGNLGTGNAQLSLRFSLPKGQIEQTAPTTACSPSLC